MKKIILLLMLIAMASLSGFDYTTMNDTVNHEYEEIDPGFMGDPYMAVDDSNLFTPYNDYWLDTLTVKPIWIYKYELEYNPKDESLTITYDNGTISRQVFPVYELDDNLKTGEYKEYEIYYEMVVHSPGVFYCGDGSTEDGGYVSGRYCKVIMLDTLFNQLIHKRVEYEAEKELNDYGDGRDNYDIKSIYIVDRIEERTTVYEE